MTASAVLFLIAVFGLTSFISVATGGTSLITVPVMMQLEVEPHVAVATNMLTVIFLSLGGTVPFLRRQLIPQERLPVLISLTLLGSILGALLLLIVPAKTMPLVLAREAEAVIVYAPIFPADPFAR